VKAIIGILALSMALQAQGFRRPDQIKKEGETELRKYFPRAVVLVSAEREAIIGFTCTTNLGDSTVSELTGVVDRSPGVQRLKQALQRGELQEYRLFGLGFEKNIIRIDPDRERSDVIGIDQVDDYINLYVQYCGSPQSAPAPPEAGYIWVGVFEVNAEWADGFKRSFVSKDTLGVYTEQDFDTARPEEIKNREALIRWFLEKQDIKPMSIQLKSIEKIRLDDKDIPR
jgi:hypothetical protein